MVLYKIACIDLTFCKLPGFNCVLSMIFMATYLHEKVYMYVYALENCMPST